MYCKKCGSQMPEGIAFCTKCGSPLKDRSKPELNVPEQAKSASGANSASASGGKKGGQAKRDSFDKSFLLLIPAAVLACMSVVLFLIAFDALPNIF